MDKWKTLDGDWPVFNRKVLLDTVHGIYLGHTNDSSDICFDEPIHYNGPIVGGSGIIKRWRYVTDKEYNNRKRSEICA